MGQRDYELSCLSLIKSCGQVSLDKPIGLLYTEIRASSMTEQCCLEAVQGDAGRDKIS